MMRDTSTRQPILRVRDLSVSAGGRRAPKPLVRGISFDLERGGVTAMVGESGSGKTLTALAILGLLPGEDLHIERGCIEFDGRDLTRESEQSLRAIRGRRISMVFQNAASSLNPCLPAREHIVEPLQLHAGLATDAARAEASRLMREVGIRDAEVRAAHYPHQFSGGEQQRLLIAAAVACAPELLIADEPTSALDAITQRQVIELLLRMQKERGFSMLYITHDLALVAGTAERVIVMQNGTIREQGARDQVLNAPSDVYTQQLTASRLRVARTVHAAPAAPDAEQPVVAAAHGLGKVYFVREGVFRRRAAAALKPMSFELHRGETLGVVGESGSGKSTLALCLTRLTAPSSGRVSWLGHDVMNTKGRALRALRRHVQVVFQNPYTTLNPRWTVRQSLLEPMRANRIAHNDDQRTRLAAAMLERVGIPADALERLPHQFSGGQRQRIAIARCLVLDPQVLVCDECVSSLDATVQLQILDLLGDLQRERQLSYLFISHDLAVVRYFTDRVIVLRQGEVVESGPTAAVCAAPRHEYTRALLQAAFTAHTERDAA
jgi:peptide/nickel transport system ATP-binding protein